MSHHSFVCSFCGSESVKLDAWAVWDIDSQSWRVSETFDAAWCDNCDGEATLKEVEPVSESG